MWVKGTWPAVIACILGTPNTPKLWNSKCSNLTKLSYQFYTPKCPKYIVNLYPTSFLILADLHIQWQLTSLCSPSILNRQLSGWQGPALIYFCDHMNHLIKIDKGYLQDNPFLPLVLQGFRMVLTWSSKKMRQHPNALPGCGCLREQVGVVWGWYESVGPNLG